MRISDWSSDVCSSDLTDIRYETLGPIARIYHDRPDRRNAEGTKMLDEIDQALARAEQDPEIRVIILGATGDHFSAGHDVKEASGRPDIVETRYLYEEDRKSVV